jgi:signal transduction histidine kinase
VKGLVAALLLAASCAAHADVQVFEDVEWLPPKWIGERISLTEAERREWSAVTLPHLWYRDLPPHYAHAWYRMRFHLDYAPGGGQSLYLPKSRMEDVRVYVNRSLVWQLTDFHRPGSVVPGLLIPIPRGPLRAGENTIHLYASGRPAWFEGMTRVYLGDISRLAERADLRRLLEQGLETHVAIAYGVIGLLALWMWLRAGRDPVLFWYGLSGVALLGATALYYAALWHGAYVGWWLALLFMRFHGYLVPFFILHLRIAGRRHFWLETALWITLVFALLRISSTPMLGPSAHSWFGWTLVFSLLPAVLAVPLLMTRRLRTRPSVLALVFADFVAFGLAIHHFGIRLGIIDFDQPSFLLLAPLFMMLAAAVPITERVRAGFRADEQNRKELERRVAEKTREIEASYAKLRETQRVQELAAERRRIMADMHDGLGARLVALLSVAQSGKAMPGEISEGIAGALDDLRLAVDSVQPVEGDVGVVLGNVRHRMRQVFERAGIRLAWNVAALPRMDSLTPERVLAIQRVFFEAFSNAIRHSGARTVSVSTQRDANAVRIVIEDDGCGFDPAARNTGTGLGNLRQRAAQAGGTLIVESQPGKGTRVTLSLTLDGAGTAEPLPSTGQETRDYPVQGMAGERASA